MEKEKSKSLGKVGFVGRLLKKGPATTGVFPWKKREKKST